MIDNFWSYLATIAITVMVNGAITAGVGYMFDAEVTHHAALAAVACDRSETLAESPERQTRGKR